MAYPYPHRHRPQGDQIEIHKLGSTSVTTAQTFTQDINLPYNGWTLGFAVWTAACDQTATFKVEPYIDHEQTLLGEDMYLVAHGTTVITQALTISAQTASESGGLVGRIYPSAIGGGDSAGQDGYYIGAHGFKVTVTLAGTASAGTLDWEIVAAPQV